MKRYMMILMVAIVSLGTLLAAAPASAQQRTRCFQETGFCVSGAILNYWERNGGLAVFGFPISDLHNEYVEAWNGPVQWFQRDRLEDHGSTGVLAGRLGAQLLEMQGRPWQSLPRAPSTPVGCRFFPETGHNLCGTFLVYWQANGGLERFGFPVSEPMQETLAAGDSTWTGTVQYLERRRLEYHPENAGTRYEVLLGLLGRDIYPALSGRCADPVPPLGPTVRAYPDVLGCPAPFPQLNARLATQQFERGSMVWAEGRGPNGSWGSIWVVYFDNARNSLVWEAYFDSWTEDQPERGGETPPPGLYEPIRGFGKLWRENAHVRETLGWAAAPERADTGSLQYFQGGAFAVYRAANDRVFIFRPDNRTDDITRIH